jgi:hypothetical protein
MGTNLAANLVLLVREKGCGVLLYCRKGERRKTRIKGAGICIRGRIQDMEGEGRREGCSCSFVFVCYCATFQHLVLPKRKQRQTQTNKQTNKK